MSGEQWERELRQRKKIQKMRGVRGKSAEAASGVGDFVFLLLRCVHEGREERVYFSNLSRLLV